MRRILIGAAVCAAVFEPIVIRAGEPALPQPPYASVSGINSSGILPHVASNAALQALAAGQYATVIRDGFAVAGDGGGASYTWSSSPCSLNSGAGDNGSEVAPVSGTGCWIIEADTTYDARIWGLVVGASAAANANATAINAAIQTLGAAGGGVVQLPCSSYASPIYFGATLDNDVSNVLVKGCAPNADQFDPFTNVSGYLDPGTYLVATFSGVAAKHRTPYNASNAENQGGGYEDVTISDGGSATTILQVDSISGGKYHVTLAGSAATYGFYVESCVSNANLAGACDVQHADIKVRIVTGYSNMHPVYLAGSTNADFSMNAHPSFIVRNSSGSGIPAIEFNEADDNTNIIALCESSTGPCAQMDGQVAPAIQSATYASSTGILSLTFASAPLGVSPATGVSWQISGMTTSAGSASNVNGLFSLASSASSGAVLNFQIASGLGTITINSGTGQLNITPVGGSFNTIALLTGGGQSVAQGTNTSGVTGGVHNTVYTVDTANNTAIPASGAGSTWAYSETNISSGLIQIASDQFLGAISSTAPAYSFQGDATTGFADPSSSQINILLGGTFSGSFAASGATFEGSGTPYVGQMVNIHACGVGANSLSQRFLANNATSVEKIYGYFNVDTVICTAGSESSEIDVGLISSGSNITPHRFLPTAFAIDYGTAVPSGGTAGMGLLFSSTSNLGVFFGSGAPTLSAAQGSLYLRSDGSSTSTRLYVNTNGSTGWTNFTSGS